MYYCQEQVYGRLMIIPAHILTHELVTNDPGVIESWELMPATQNLVLQEAGDRQFPASSLDHTTAFGM